MKNLISQILRNLREDKTWEPQLPSKIFPCDRVKGCRFHLNDWGVPRTGKIDYVDFENGVLYFFAVGEEAPAFSIPTMWGVWGEKGGDIELSIPFVGNATFFDVRPEA